MLQLDAKDYASYDGVVQQVTDIVGDQGLDALINNHGVLHRVDLNTVGPEQMLDNFEVNAVTPLILTKAFLPLLRQAASNKRKPVVANITSKMGSLEDNTSGGHYAYRASKVST